MIEDALSRAEMATADFNAFAHLDVDGALSAADALDRAKGRLVGPLHGIPVAVKDVIDVAGLPVTGGSRHLADRRPRTDATSVAALRRAGAVIVGITVTHEMAYGPTGDRSAHGAVLNPCDPARIAGGSSAGSAVAVATSAVPLSLGTDTGGSVRIPGALSGVLGLKPTYGAISNAGTVPLSPSLDHVGLHASTVGDLRVGLAVLTGRPAPAHVGPLRAAWLDFGVDPIDPELAERVRRLARAAFGILGPARMDPELAARIREDFSAVQGAEAHAQHAHRIATRPDLFDPEVLERLEAAAKVPAWKYTRALDRRDELRRAVLRQFGTADVLVTPTTPISAPLLDQREIDMGGTRAAVRDVLLSLTHQWNLLGFPALSVPISTPRLPAGLQLIAPPGGEERLLAAADRILSTQYRQKRK
ncbi:aspartyl-tRNA(Asn)/glutamyl-tRNA(Gln) amidotransferase subunit A [Nocardioides thalensis]|uniref:Aspartyl-tRNA(Asn)/glutamyl-tRNA(Gln) amidotransferase subunit A n=1 Tax=Nocardioides thalensis TaxID=1914755 RepID=A0A853BYR7_9ACTN|nr:aspartyl-tRNA(Asn)/glutamyl-tRNA(Gln) amidotransferase subunit A [Nocardioides thalensis]